MDLSLIVAMSRNRVIGRDGDLPWRLSADLKRFKSLTMGHHLIMGRKTFDSIGRPLPGRTTVVISRQSLNLPEGVLAATSLESAVEICAGDEQPFVVGGGEIYRIALPRVTKMFITHVDADIDGDTTFPEVDWSVWRVVREELFDRDEKNSFPFRFVEYAKLA